MKLEIFSIYDSASEIYMRPIAFQSLGQAIRSFRDAVADTSSELGKHPRDYSLIQIAMFCDNTGVLKPNVERTCAITGLEALAANRKEHQVAKQIDIEESINH